MDFSTHHNKDVIFLLIITLVASVSAIYIVFRANKVILQLDAMSESQVFDKVK
jgi:cell division protein FtsL